MLRQRRQTRHYKSVWGKQRVKVFARKRKRCWNRSAPIEDRDYNGLFWSKGRFTLMERTYQRSRSRHRMEPQGNGYWYYSPRDEDVLSRRVYFKLYGCP